MRLILANLSDTCLTGLCLFFVRTKVDAVINPKNIHEVRIIKVQIDVIDLHCGQGDDQRQNHTLN